MYRIAYAITLILTINLPAYTQPATSCHPVLWPLDNTLINAPTTQDIRVELQQWSIKHLHQPIHPVCLLGSAGKTALNDEQLIASRRAFQDADRAVVFAINYQLTHQREYFNKTRDILVHWAHMNHPTGNPIDETRLDGMIWAYDLINCDLNQHDNTMILNWFKQIKIKKMAWVFGHTTAQNNHHIHQLKMLLLLDKVLGLDDDLRDDIHMAEQLACINLNPQSGVSLDYLERHALYYHNYVLQPWIEINLITGCCQKPVNQAFLFLKDHILSHKTQHEFLHSSAKIDALRAHHGFAYARANSTFDVTRAAPTIIAYYTMKHITPIPTLWIIQQKASPSPHLLFLKARRQLWRPS